MTADDFINHASTIIDDSDMHKILSASTELEFAHINEYEDARYLFNLCNEIAADSENFTDSADLCEIFDGF